MKIFQCSRCDFPVFFENTICENCDANLGYLDSENDIFAKPPEDENWLVKGKQYSYCKNEALNTCNWLVPAESEIGLCQSCYLNRTIPDTSNHKLHERLQNMEAAKHRLVYTLQCLGLPVKSRFEDTQSGLFFDFLSKGDVNVEGNKVMTGHANGVVTILLGEADVVNRETMRVSLNEKYRTLIGHFRHEVGHYYWDVIFQNNDEFLSEFRTLFGDERESYADALEVHYQNGAPKNWKTDFISEYASSHPWEDWAETWAHYLHILDTMETAYYFGLNGDPKLRNSPHMRVETLYPYREDLSFKTILEETIPLFYAVNSINRSMGIKDVYPFAISAKVKDKLEYVHYILQRFKAEKK
ncbi:hypothetical protein F6U93_04425 [Tamlana haliotis]|uniref:Zinc-ribbon domain-containing protein n=1 Tax=Pseudotamlana haliotis TaxID=2614804 RepID=A0A6N6MFC3_9FLAO|nr:putative zinc-binding metallopeptidase [Tamlana haliotis]KAB1069006.1 hypothetical protein F6U93_04425 [Tamlana haliotis]